MNETLQAILGGALGGLIVGLVWNGVRIWLAVREPKR